MPVALARLTPSSRTPAPSNRSAALPSERARRKRRRRRSSSRQSRARLVPARQVELAAEAARHRPVVELERMSQAVDIASIHAKAGVDLFAVVVARIPQREQSFGANVRVALANRRRRRPSRSCFRRRYARRRRPRGVPRAHVLAGEQALDSRPPERSGRPPSNSPRPPKVTGSGARPEIGQDAGQHLVAFLPVAARHMEAERRARRPTRWCRRTMTCVFSVANSPSVTSTNVGPVAVGASSGDRQVRGERRPARTVPTRDARDRRPRRATRRATAVIRDARQRRDRDRPSPRCSLKSAHRPFEQIASAGAACQPQPRRACRSR